MAIGIDGLMVDYGQAVVTLDASGYGTRAVAFAQRFPSTPQIQVVIGRADEGAGAVYQVQAGSAGASGFVVEVIGSAITSADLKVIWQAHEKPGG